MKTTTLHITPGQLRTTAQAWESGGSIALGHWAVRAKLRDWGVAVYGELLGLVRERLGDDIDYSEAPAQATRREIIVRAVQESARIAAARPEKGRGR